MKAAIHLSLGLWACASCGTAPEATVQPMPRVDARPALIAPAAVMAGYQPVASYKIEATLDQDKHRVRGTQTLTWVNTSRTAVSELPFHLYLNGFKNESAVFMRESRGAHSSMHVEADGWGWIDVTAISVDGGADLTARASNPEGADESVLRVPLDRPVPPGGKVAVAMAFEAQLPVVFARTGYQGDFTMIAQWFPKIGVLVGPPDRATWHCEPFHVMSEFFADFGTYDVSLTVPDVMVVAATGVLTEAVDNPDATRTLRYHAEAVHDFVWMTDPFMQTISGFAKTEHGDVEVRVLFREPQREFADRHLRAGIAAVEGFSRTLVAYPWSRMTIVDPPREAASGAGGMEYPTLVTTGFDMVFAPEGVREPEFTTIHEVGHNWFQGILASNEVDEAWLDEGLNMYADGVVLHHVYGLYESGVDWGPFYAERYELDAAVHRPFAQHPDPVARRSFDYVDARSYATSSYTRVAALMRTLEATAGTSRVRAALGAYAREMAFKHPTEADFERILERELGEDLDWYLGPALHGVGAADLRVRWIDCQRKGPPSGVFGRGAEQQVVDTGPADSAPYACFVTVQNAGALAVPVDVEMTFADGETKRLRWDDRGKGPRWHRFEIESPQPIVQVVIDPDGLVVLDDGGHLRSLRVAEDGGPSRRAAARAQFWTQTAMQVLGL